MKTNKIMITVGDRELSVVLAENSSAEALVELLQKTLITIAMKDYGNMEKVGIMEQSLPSNNQQITTEAGDVILYQGNALVIYYDTNQWSLIGYCHTARTRRPPIPFAGHLQ